MLFLKSRAALFCLRLNRDLAVFWKAPGSSMPSNSEATGEAATRHLCEAEAHRSMLDSLSELRAWSRATPVECSGLMPEAGSEGSAVGAGGHGRIKGKGERGGARGMAVQSGHQGGRRGEAACSGGHMRRAADKPEPQSWHRANPNRLTHCTRTQWKTLPLRFCFFSQPLGVFCISKLFFLLILHLDDFLVFFWGATRRLGLFTHSRSCHSLLQHASPNGKITSGTPRFNPDAWFSTQLPHFWLSAFSFGNLQKQRWGGRLW